MPLRPAFKRRMESILRRIDARTDLTFFDESNPTYEAARLAHNPVVIVYWVEESDDPPWTIMLLVAKGVDEMMQHLNDGGPVPDFEALVASGKEPAEALCAAFKRLDKPALRLVH
jgi:hypothetical protein